MNPEAYEHEIKRKDRLIEKLQDENKLLLSVSLKQQEKIQELESRLRKFLGKK